MQRELISIEEFGHLDLRIGVIKEAADHPKADRLVVLKVDVGEPDTRQLVAGVKGSYHAGDLVGKLIVVVANLKPATLRGIESQGMLLAATGSSGVVLLSPEKPVAVGSPVK